MILKLLLNILLILSCFNSSSTCIDVNRNLKIEQDTNELVVVFENYNSKFHPEILILVNQINGLKSKGYCESLSCFYFEVDPTIFRSQSEAFEVLESKTKRFNAYRKLYQ
jgi:hypothetical protein